MLPFYDSELETGFFLKILRQSIKHKKQKLLFCYTLKTRLIMMLNRKYVNFDEQQLSLLSILVQKKKFSNILKNLYLLRKMQ